MVQRLIFIFVICVLVKSIVWTLQNFILLHVLGVCM